MKFVGYDESTYEIKPFDPITASMPADLAGVYFAIKDNASTPAYHLVPVDISYIAKSEETVIDTGMQTTTGIKETRTYKIRIPCDMILAGKIILFGKSGALNSTASTTNAARVNLNLQKNGSAISGVTKVNGTERIPNSTTEVNYTEILGIDLPSTSFSAGDTLDIIVELEVTSADSNGIQFKLYCDPATSGNELVLYLQIT